MRLRRCIIRRLDSDEVFEQPMMAEHQTYAALRFAGRDTQHHVVALREFGDGFSSPGIERLDGRAGRAHGMEGVAVMVGEALGRELMPPLPELGEGLN